MPLYKSRPKKSLLSQISQKLDSSQEISNVPALKQTHSSQKSDGDILQANDINSPTYPEKYVASEPSESAFLEYNEFKELGLKKEAYPPLLKHDQLEQITDLTNSTESILHGKETSTEVNDKLLFPEVKGTYEPICNEVTEITDLEDNIEYQNLFSQQKNKGPEDFVEVIYEKGNISNPNKKLLPTDNVDEIFKKLPSKVLKKKNENKIKDNSLLNNESVQILSRNKNQKKSLKSNELKKTKKIEKVLEKNDPAKNPNRKSIKGYKSKSRKENVTQFDTAHSQELHDSQAGELEGQNLLLNSSGNSQLSMNDPNIKNAFKRFLKESQFVNDSLTQHSDISMSDPTVKDAYVKFLEKSEKFKRVATPIDLSHDAKLKWLHEQRNTGVYVHCDRCDKIRYLNEIMDPTDLPEKWYCENNKDKSYDKCDIPQEMFPVHIQADWIDNLYNAGSLVWARVEGYPWWPGIVDDDPNTESYYWLEDEFTNEPSYYHVTFFDEKEVTRAWLKPSQIKSFTKELKNSHLLPGKLSLFKKRIDFAIQQAKQAVSLSILDRLRKYSFVARYQKPIKRPRPTMDELINKKKKLKDQNERKTMKVDQNNKAKNKTAKKIKKNEELCDISFSDLEIPASPTFDNISFELFEDV